LGKKGKIDGQHMHFFNTVKEKRIQARCATLQRALPSGFNQIGGEEKHKVAKKNNKAKKS
jgi:hypothetical protein